MVEALGSVHLLAVHPLDVPVAAAVVRVVAGVAMPDMVNAPAAPIPIQRLQSSQPGPAGGAVVPVEDADVGVVVNRVVVQNGDVVPLVLAGPLCVSPIVPLIRVVPLIDVDGGTALVPVIAAPVVRMRPVDADVHQK